MERPIFEVICGKIVTSSHLPDRVLIVHTYIPKDEDERKRGSFYILTEIKNPYFPSVKIAQEINKNLIENFYSDSKNQDFLLNFEESLKKINEKLQDLASSGNNDWVGNLNSIILSFSGSSVHISYTGNAQAYLFREQNLSHITQEPPPSNPHPLKTYGSIISGDIQKGDHILLTNSEYFDYISLYQSREAISAFTPQEAISKLGQILKKQKILHVNALILEITTAQEAQTFISELPDEFYLDKKQENWLEKTIPHKQPEVTQPNGVVSEIEKPPTLSQKFFPIAKLIITSLGKFSIKIGRRIKGNVGHKKSSRINKIQNTKVYYKPRPQPIAEQSRHIRKKFFQSIFEAFILFFNKIFFLFIRIFKYFSEPGRRKIFYASSIVLIGAILVFTISIFRRYQGSQVNDVNALQAIQEAKAKEKEAQGALDSNQKDIARTIFLQSLELLSTAKSYHKTREEAEQLELNIQSKLDQIDHIIRIQDADQVIDFYQSEKEINLKQFFLIDTVIFAMNGKNNQLIKANLSGNIENFAEIPKTAGTPTLSAIMGQDNIIVYYDDQKVYSINIQNKQVARNDLVIGVWNDASAISTYGTSIYLLSSNQGQIWKYTKAGTKYSQPKLMVNSFQLDIKGSRSIAIDGAIYVLQSNGELIRLIKGRKDQDFQIKGIPTPNTQILDPIRTFTANQINFIYTLEQGNHRIIEFDKEGNYIRQFVFSQNYSSVVDFKVDYKSKKLYFLNDNKIYEISI